jgi:tetratricopeptide (TPR) repeat protein
LTASYAESWAYAAKENGLYFEALIYYKKAEKLSQDDAFKKRMKNRASLTWFAWRHKGALDIPAAEWLRETSISPDAYKSEDAEERLIACGTRLYADSANTEAYFERGNIHCSLGHYDAALANYQEAVRLKKDPRFYAAQGDLYFLMKNIQKSFSAYGTGRKIFSRLGVNDETTNFFMERISLMEIAPCSYSFNKDASLSQEIERITDLITRNSAVFRYYRLRGFLNREYGDFDASLADFNKARELCTEEKDRAFLQKQIDIMHKLMRNNRK